MKTNLISKCSAFIMVSLLAVIPAAAAPYEKGSRMEVFSAKDQHGAEYEFKPAAVKYLLVSHDMDTGKQANAVLTNLGKDYLSNKKAVYLANIHGMPNVGRMFAIPKMKKYAHRIILGDDDKLIAKFPMQAGKVTVIGISGGKVTSVSYWDPADGDPATLLK